MRATARDLLKENPELSLKISPLYSQNLWFCFKAFATQTMTIISIGHETASGRGSMRATAFAQISWDHFYGPAGIFEHTHLTLPSEPSGGALL